VSALVWVLPVVALVCGVAGLGAAFLRWRRRLAVVPSAADRILVAEARRT
jgi:hypothetical protein